jgi:hypothetical protein
MPDADPNGNGQVGSAPNNRVHNDGKQWAQDLVLEEIGQNNPRLCAKTKKWILVIAALGVVAGGVAVGVVLSKGGDNDDGGNSTEAPREADGSSAPSYVPSPTRRPSLSPVTEQPTDDPTLDPTLPPTELPTASPVAATPVPTTNRPTSLPTSPSVVDQFLSGLPAYSIDLASTNSGSPQAKALEWLKKDPRYDEYLYAYRLNQRYALAVLYYSTNGDSWLNNTGWLSNDTECSWYSSRYNDKICAEASRVSFLNLDSNRLDGTIPTELELLTDLEEMFFTELSLSGTIHSEL